MWAPVGERPTALGHHRYKWLHVTAFVQPTSGEAVRFLSTGLSKPRGSSPRAGSCSRLCLPASRNKPVQAASGTSSSCSTTSAFPRSGNRLGWHDPKNLAVPDGITLAFLPPYSPELQPAERLWPLVDEPVANRHFATLTDLDAVVAERCRRLDADTIRPHTSFHWWPKPVQ